MRERYLGQSEDRAINDKCVDIGYDIEDAEERKQNASNETQMISSIDKKVRSSLHDLGNKNCYEKKHRKVCKIENSYINVNIFSFNTC